jgi:hypothetical protein
MEGYHPLDDKKGLVLLTKGELKQMSDRNIWQVVKRITFLFALLGLICIGVACENSEPKPTPTLPPTLPPTPPIGLDDDASQWKPFYYNNGGAATGKLKNVPAPSRDGNGALEISLSGGASYTGIQAYDNFPSNSDAKTFSMSLSFYFTDLASIQALEFTMSQWVSDQRWEFALQWQHIGGGGSGNPPDWRIWNGGDWQDSGVMQQLSFNSWHTFQLKGDIVGGRVHYVSFTCDDVSQQLGQTFDPVSMPGDKLAIGVQLDGNSQGNPYDVYIDEVTFSVK